MSGAVLVHPGGQIGEVHFKWLVQLDDGSFLTVPDLFQFPFRIAFRRKQDIAKVKGFGDADAAVAEVALCTIEQGLGGSVMNVDIEFVRKNELDPPERVIRSRVLAQLEREVSP